MTRILCVDDTPAARYVFTRVLRSAGYDVIEGATAAEALRLVHEERPDLLLLDVNLPDGNGRDVCMAIRSDAAVAHTPVVLTSASSVAGLDRIQGLNCGADGYVTQPASPDELLAVVNSMLRMSRAERMLAILNAQLEARVKELETLINTVPIGIAISRDPACERMVVNPPFAEMFGAPGAGEVSSDSLIGLQGSARTASGGAQVDPCLAMQAAVATASVIRDREYDVIRNDGTHLQIFGNAAPLLDDRGMVNGAVGAFIDVTESKRQETWRRMLAEASMLLADTLVLEKTLERIAQIAVRHISDWCVVDMVRPEERFERLYVTHRDPAKAEAAAKLHAKHAPDEDRPYTGFRALQTLQPQLIRDWTEGSHDFDEEFMALVGELGMRSYISAPLVARGRCHGVITIINATKTYDEKDVSAVMLLAERAALAVDNAMLFEAADEASRTKDDFLALVSHELRTPLTAICGWIELLQRDLDSATVRQGLHEVGKSTTTLRRLVEDLLDLSRISTGKLRVESRTVDLAVIASDACDVARAPAGAKSIVLTLTADDPVFVAGDAVRIQQIASNLLNNAVKFTPRGGRIDVSVTAADGQVILRVSDTGRGIRPEFLPRVFERFAQAETSGAAGLGIGLALVKQLTELHGGKVMVVSEGEGKGATFSVSFPRVAPPAESDSDSHSQEQAAL